jgi:hypothetical protein
MLRCCRSFRAASSLRRPLRESANGSLDFLYAIKAFASRLKEMEKWNGALLGTATGRFSLSPPAQRGERGGERGANSMADTGSIGVPA